MHCHPHSPERRAARQHSSLGMALLCIGGLVGTGMAAQARQDAVPLEIHARALDAAPQSPIEGAIEGGATMDSAVAGVLIGAIAAQFESDVGIGVRLDRIAVDPASLRDREVSGKGRLRIGDAGDWIPFRFAAMYDTRTSEVGYPHLVLGDGDAAEPIAADSAIARRLLDRAGLALAREFGTQTVGLSLDRVAAVAAGDRYLAVRAIGSAAFEGEGRTPARVRALYDRDSGRWLRVEYELGASAGRAEREFPAVASR